MELIIVTTVEWPEATQSLSSFLLLDIAFDEMCSKSDTENANNKDDGGGSFRQRRNNRKTHKNIT